MDTIELESDLNKAANECAEWRGLLRRAAVELSANRAQLAQAEKDLELEKADREVAQVGEDEARTERDRLRARLAAILEAAEGLPEGVQMTAVADGKPYIITPLLEAVNEAREGE